MMIHLRPARSASGLSRRFPSIKPNSPALKTGPSAPRDKCHSRASAGATLADRLRIIAIDEEHRGAHQNEPDLIAANRLMIDEIGEIDAGSGGLV